jgi:hypothetical protein
MPESPACACARSALLPARAPQGPKEPRPRIAGRRGANPPRPPRTLRDRPFRVSRRSQRPGPLGRDRRRYRSGVAWSDSDLCHSPRSGPHRPFGLRLSPRSRSRLRRGIVDLRSGVGDLRRIVVHSRSGVFDPRSSVVELHPGAEGSSREADGAGQLPRQPLDLGPAEEAVVVSGQDGPVEAGRDEPKLSGWHPGINLSKR